MEFIMPMGLNPAYRQVMVDTEEALYLLRVFDEDPVHAAALEIKLRAIFSDKVVTKQIGVEMLGQEEDDAVDYHFAKYYTPELCKALRPLGACGYLVHKPVAITDETLGDRTMLVPIIVPRERYKLYCRIHNDERREWLVMPVGKNDFDPSYKVFMIPRHEPDPMTGKHHSMISPTVRKSLYIRSLYEDHARAIHQRSHPPVVLESVDKGPNQELVTMYAPTATLQTTQVDQAINKIGVAITTQQIATELQHQTTGAYKVGDKVIGPDGTVSAYRSTMDDNQYYLPPGYKLANLALPDAQGDLLDFVNDWRQEVLALHGIPAAVVTGGGKSNDHSKGSAVDDNDITMFQRTLRLANSELCQLATEFYLSTRPDLSGKSNRSFHIKMIPFTTPSALQRMFEQHIIHHDALKTHMLSLNGLMDDDLADGENEIIAPPLHGNENQTTALIKAKEKVMLAEASEREAKAKESKEGNGQETELMRMQMELEKQKIEGEKELLEAKLAFEKAKIDIGYQKLQLDKEGLKVKEQEEKMKAREAKRQKTASAGAKKT
jgi:hypothetical protein